jgi:hypothetical protein
MRIVLALSTDIIIGYANLGIPMTAEA